MSQFLLSRRGLIAAAAAGSMLAVPGVAFAQDEDAVAQIKGKAGTFDTVAEAISAADDGDTIELLDDVYEASDDANVMYQIPVNRKVFITSVDPSNPVEFHGCLRFCAHSDGSVVENVKFVIDKRPYSSSAPMLAGVVISCASNVTVKNCEFDISGAQAACYGVYVATDSTSLPANGIVVSDNKFTVQSANYVCCVYANTRNDNIELSLVDNSFNITKTGKTAYAVLGQNSNSAAGAASHELAFSMTGANVVSNATIGVAFMNGNGSGPMTLKPGSKIENAVFKNYDVAFAYFYPDVIPAVGDFTIVNCGFDSTSIKIANPGNKAVISGAHLVTSEVATFALDEDEAFEVVDVIGGAIEAAEL